MFPDTASISLKPQANSVALWLWDVHTKRRHIFVSFAFSFFSSRFFFSYIIQKLLTSWDCMHRLPPPQKSLIILMSGSVVFKLMTTECPGSLSKISLLTLSIPPNLPCSKAINGGLGRGQKYAFLHTSKGLLRPVGQRTLGLGQMENIWPVLFDFHQNTLFLTDKMWLFGERWRREERHGSCPNCLAIVSNLASWVQKVCVYALFCPRIQAIVDLVHTCLHGIRWKEVAGLPTQGCCS